MNDIYVKIVGLLVLIGGAIALYFRGYVSGKKDEKSSQAQSDLAAERRKGEVVSDAKQVADAVSRLPDGSAAQQLRDKYSRD